MAGRFLAGFGNVLVAILKAIAWLILNALQLVLNVAKVFLLLLGLVGRLFLAFVRAGTPQEGGGNMKTFANYRKNRRLVQYFFRMKKLCV